MPSLLEILCCRQIAALAAENAELRRGWPTYATAREALAKGAVESARIMLVIEITRILKADIELARREAQKGNQ